MQNVIILSWPDKSLSSNARIHWAKKAKATKAARNAASYATLAAKVKVAQDGAINLNVRFFPPDKRRRDGTNMLASCKAYFDGIADVLKVDDVRFHVSYDVCGVKAGGEVRIEVID